MKELRLVLVMPDADLRRRLARALSGLGYHPQGFRSVEELEGLDRRITPEVIICPVELCGGVENRIKRLFPRGRNVQYVQTFDRDGRDGEDVLARFRRENFDCLPVPFTRTTLALSIERAIERRQLIARNLRSRKKLERAVRDLEENLRILQADQLAGRQVQQALLPRSPVFPGSYYAALKVLPSLYLSGDFVNYQSALDRYLLFYVTDVSGHGASSAFITVMVKQIMTRIVSHHIRNSDLDSLARAPEGFIERINTFLCDGELEKHLTMFAGSLDMQENRLRYAVGAQLPMPILVHEGKACFLTGEGKPVGLFTDASWSVEEIKLPRKFILIGFSDGILEVLPQKTLAKKEQFLLEALADCDADIETVLPRLGLKDASSLPDDIAILMLARGYPKSA